MALKLRKDIKKSLYYVWFLGAKESKGLRGSEFILPVIKHLEQREKDVEPFKVTLQISHKGLKIIQNVVSQGKSKPKNETIKHFIPHNTITCVHQQGDVISCILLLFNPVTKCPLHVHVYRCDSVETATLLKQQLQVLIDSPENQKKFAEIEAKLNPPKEVKKVESSLGSDTGKSSRESESSEERYHIENTRITNLYDSVAAELRAKLSKKNVPILLPPRDYDTVHRQKGNLTGIELRRCLNTNIVGQNIKGRRIESSGGSSGIGSDHPPSPDSPDAPDTRFNTLDNHSTSDEDWNADNADSTLYLMNSTPHVTLPRPSRNTERSPERTPDDFRQYNRYHDKEDNNNRKNKYRDEFKEMSKYPDKSFGKYVERSRETLDHRPSSNHRSLDRQPSGEKLDRMNGHKSLEKHMSKGRMEQEVPSKYYFSEPLVAKRYPEKDRYVDKGRYEGKYYEDERREKKDSHPDDGFDENMRYMYPPNKEKSTRYQYEQDDFDRPRVYHDLPVPKTRQKYQDYPPEKYNYHDQETKQRPRSSVERYQKGDRRYPEEDFRGRPKSANDNLDNRNYRNQDSFEDYHNRRLPQYRQRSPSPPEDVKVSPKDRFKDAKEKFLSMEKERQEMEKNRRDEPPITPVHTRPFLKRHESMIKERYDESYFENGPKPAPRNIDDRYRRESPVERYRNVEKNDPKRRSMFSLIEEEHRKNSSEIAKELRRRSYIDGASFEGEYPEKERSFQELPESDRYHERDYFSKSSHHLDKVAESKYDPKFVKNQKVGKGSGGYRHSYAEPKMRIERKGYDMLHRTNSSVSNNGRVGIAAVHPY